MTDHPVKRVALEAAVREVLGRVELRVGALEEDLLATAAVAPRRLPDDYRSFLRASDGAEGWIGENYIEIAPARQAVETTQAFAEFVPGLFFFAGDGAAGLFAFDLRTEDAGVAITHTDDLNFAGLVRVADSFTAFLGFLHRCKWSEFWFTERSRRHWPADR